jgi:predicted aspartyl protease
MRLFWAAALMGLAVMSSLSAPASADGRAPAATRLASGPRGEPVVAVTLNGAGPFLFVLDTGSTHTSIAETLAASLGMVPVAKTTVTSSAGQTAALVFHIERLEVGPVAARQVLASGVAGPGLDRSGRIRGVLGQDVLADHRYTIDFAGRWIAWGLDALDAWPGSVSLPLSPQQARFIVELPQADTVLRLVPDSGSEGLVLYRRPDHRVPGLTGTSETVWLDTLSGRAPARRVSLRELRVGPLSLRDTPAVLVDLHADGASDADGLLPLHLFDRVTFDGRRRLLVLSHR